MPLSVGLPLGLLLVFTGVFGYLVTKRKNKIWAGVGLLGALITLGTLVVIVLAVNSM